MLVLAQAIEKQPAAKPKPAAEPAAKSTGPPLGMARPRAKARRAATPESPHGRVATPPEITYACARTGSRATGADRV